MMACSGIVQIGVCYLFVHTFGLKLQGAAVALTITYFVNMTSFITYSQLSKQTRHTVAPWGRESFRNFGDIFKYGIPSAAQLFLDWAAFEVLAILIGQRGVDQLAASVIMVNFSAQMYSIPMALGFATVALVGNSIGEGKKFKAITYARVTGIVIGIISVLIAIILMLLRYQIV